MLDLSTQEHICPSCQVNFFPQQKAVKKVLCGDDHLYTPKSKKYQVPECKIYYFCSQECANELESKVSSFSPPPRWKRFMARIGRVSAAGGIAGARCHDLPK